MPLYEVELQDGRESEIRLTDEPLAVGSVIRIGAQTWYVHHRTALANREAEARFVCIAAPEAGEADGAIPIDTIGD